MYPIRYHIVRKQGNDQIHSPGNAVYLTVYQAGAADHQPSTGEKQFYCEPQGRLLIFETTGYKPLMNPFHLQSLYAAIKWYCNTRCNAPDVKIRLTDPRRNWQNKRKD